MNTPRYKVGDRVCLDLCPDPGTVVEIRQLPHWNEYRMTWDDWPDDHGWYSENKVLREGAHGIRS